MTENPYSAPESEPQPPATDLMTWKTVRFILLVGVAGLVAGAFLGLLIAALNPSYYEIVFGGSRATSINPWLMGLSLGLSQGFIGGIAVGVVLSIADAWLKLRQAARSRSGF